MRAHELRRVRAVTLAVAIACATGLLASCSGHAKVAGQLASPSTTGSTTTLVAAPPTTTSSTRPPSTPSSAPTTTSTGGTRTILAPATVAPATDECSLKVTNEADGNVVPLLCPAGGVNVSAWSVYARGFVGSGPLTPSRTLAIGRAATAAQIRDAMCADYHTVYGTKPLTISAERLAAAYYGWAFSSNDLVDSFSRADCPVQ